MLGMDSEVLFSPAVSMSIPRCSPLVPLHPFACFGAIFPTKFWHPKLLSIAFSLRHEGALLVLVSQKLVWIIFSLFNSVLLHALIVSLFNRMRIIHS